MKNEPSRQVEILISITDFLAALKKKRKFITLFAFFLGLLALIFNITEPVMFEAKGTFKEKGSTQTSIGGKMQVLMGSIAGDSSTSSINLMKSRKVMDRVVKKLNLQARLIEEIPKSTWVNLSNNIKGINAYLTSRFYGSLLHPIFEEDKIKVSCQDIDYNLRYLSSFKIKFISDELYVLTNSKGQKKQYSINEKVSFDGCSFYLKNEGTKNLKGTKFNLVFYPLNETSLAYSAKMIIETDKKDKSLIKIAVKNPSPQLAANLVNLLMDSYKEYLEEVNKKSINEQLSYLNFRKGQIDQGFNLLMQEHSDHVKNKILELGGFPNSEQELSFLSDQQGSLKNRAFELNRSKALIEGDEKHDYLCNESIASTDKVFSELYLKKREMEQKYDSFSLDIIDIEEANPKKYDDALKNDFDKLNSIRNHLDEIDIVTKKLSSNNPLSSKLKIIKDSFVISEDLKNYFNNNLLSQYESTLATPDYKECSQYLEAISSYLDNQKKLLLMRLELVKSRLFFQKDYDENFEGLNLESAEELLKDFNLKLNQSITNLNLYSVAESQFKDVNFEVTSLSSILQNDSVIMQTISEVSSIQKKLHDINNLSSKEVDRLKNDLSVKKNFIKDHIKYVKEGNIEEGSLLKIRIFNLKKSIMDFLKREITVINNQLNDYKRALHQSIEEENTLIKNLLINLNASIANSSEKWFEEKKLETATVVQTNVISEITKLVETQNISSNLSKSESSPLDYATVPVVPKILHIFIYTILFAVLGFILGASIITMNVIFRGVIASKDNLALLGKSILGTFLKDPTEDIKVARRAVSFINSDTKIISFINTLGLGFVSLVATLMTKKGKKIIILDMTFLNIEEIEQKEENSLKNYLEGDFKNLRPHSTTLGYDYLYGGSYSRFGIELLQKKEFSNFLEALKNQYDVVLMNLPIEATSLEAHLLRDLAQKTIVTLKDEKLNDLTEYFNEENDQVGFVFAKEC